MRGVVWGGPERETCAVAGDVLESRSPPCRSGHAPRGERERQVKGPERTNEPGPGRRERVGAVGGAWPGGASEPRKHSGAYLF